MPTEEKCDWCLKTTTRPQMISGCPGIRSKHCNKRVPYFTVFLSVIYQALLTNNLLQYDSRVVFNDQVVVGYLIFFASGQVYPE